MHINTHSQVQIELISLSHTRTRAKMTNSFCLKWRLSTLASIPSPSPAVGLSRYQPGSTVVFKWMTHDTRHLIAEWLPRSTQVKFRSQYLWSAYSYVQPPIGKWTCAGFSSWMIPPPAYFGPETWKYSTWVRSTPWPPSLSARHQDYDQRESLHFLPLSAP